MLHEHENSSIPPQRSRGWAWIGWVLFYLFLAPIAKFWRFWTVKSPHQLFMNGDVYHEYWPDMHVHVEALRGGDWAIYNPFMNFGFPIVSDPQNGVYYPLSWIYLVAGALLDRVSAFYVFEWVTLAPVGLFGLGMHCYLRQIGLSHRAALLGGLVAMSNGFVNRAYYLKFMQSFAWLPWAMLALEWLMARPTWRRAAALGFVCGMSVLAGGPPGVFYLVFWLTAYFVFRVVQEGRACGWKEVILPLLRWLPFSIAVAGALAAVVVLPFMDILHTTRRVGVGYHFMADTWVHYFHVLGFLLPGYEPLYYHGLLTLVLAGAAMLLSRRLRSLVIFCVFSGILGILLSMGPHAFAIDLVYLGFPGAATFRRSIRYHFLLAVALPILVAIGLDGLLARATAQHSKRFLRGLAFALLLLLPTLWGIVWFGELYEMNYHALRPILHITAVFVLGAAFLFTLRIEPRSLWWYGLFLFVFVFDLYAYHPMYDTSPHSRFVGWTSPILRAQPRGPLAAYRTMNDIEDGSRNASNIYLVRDAMNYDHPLLSRRYYELLPIIRQDPDILRFFNVYRYLACLPGNDHYQWCLGKHQRFSSRWQNEGRQGYIQSYRLIDPIPRILWVPHVVQVDRKNDVIPAMQKLDHWRVVIVEADDLPHVAGLSVLPWPPLTLHHAPRSLSLAPKPPPKPPSRGVPAVVHRASFNQIRATLDAPNEGIVLINELFYKDWRATLNGKPIPLFRANFMLMGVRVPKGQHTLQLAYHPRSFFLGAALTSFAALLFLLTLLLDRRLPLRSPSPLRAP